MDINHGYKPNWYGFYLYLFLSFIYDNIYIHHKPWLTSWNFHPSRRFTMFFFRDETIMLGGFHRHGGSPKWLLYDLYNGKSSEHGWSVPPWLPIYETSSTTIWKTMVFQHGLTIWKTMLHHGSPWWKTTIQSICWVMSAQRLSKFSGLISRWMTSIRDVKTVKNRITATLCLGSSSEKDEQRMFRSCYRDILQKPSGNSKSTKMALLLLMK